MLEILPVSILTTIIIVCSVWFCISNSNISQPLESQISFKSNHPLRSYDVIRFFKLAATTSQIYFRCPVCRRLTTIKKQNYFHSKFRQNISVVGWSITTFGFYKQTAAISKFYFRLRFWAFHRHWHMILHRITKLCPNWRSGADLSHYLNFPQDCGNMAPILSQIYFCFSIFWCLTLRKVETICVPNFDIQSTGRTLVTTAEWYHVWNRVHPTAQWIFQT